MKYRISPFNIVAILFGAAAIYSGIVIYGDEKDPGLGGLLPIALLSYAIGFLVADFIFQIFLKRKIKLLFIIQSILVIIGLIFLLWPTNSSI